MKKITLVFAIILSVMCIEKHANATQITAGMFKQTSSTWGGDCPSCVLTITTETEHIIRIVSNNYWIGYAIYNQEKDDYTGYMEWQKGHGLSWEGIPIKLVIIFEKNTLNVEFISTDKTKSAGKATYRLSN